jgi:hypothetical protein
MATDPDAPVTMLALNEDKTKVVDVDSAEAAFLVRKDELEDHLVVKPKKAEKESTKP